MITETDRPARGPDADWEILGLEDRATTGTAGVLRRHTTTGDVWVWLMDGTSISSAGLVATVGDLNDRIAGTRDYNADGRVEVLWRHQTTGALWMWTVNGVSITSVTWVGTVPDTGYRVQNPK